MWTRICEQLYSLVVSPADLPLPAFTAGNVDNASLYQWTQVHTQMLPLTSVLCHCGGVQHYYQRLSTLLALFNSTLIPQETVQFVSYWRDAAACFLPNSCADLADIAAKAASFLPSKFLNPSYLASILQATKSTSLYRVFVLTLRAMISDQPDVISTFEAALLHESDLWQHSASFLQDLLQLSGLHSLHIATSLPQPSFGLSLNPYLVLISALVSANFTSPFAVLLSDSLCSLLSSAEKPCTWLPAHLPLVPLLRPYVDKHHKDLCSLIALSILRVLLDKVTIYMHQFTYSDSSKSTLAGLNEAVAGLPDCLLYGVKSLKALSGYSYTKLRELIGYREACSWLKGWKWPESRQFDGGLTPPNPEMYIKLANCIEGNGDFGEIVEELRTTSGKLTFMLRIMEETYCKYRETEARINPKVTEMLTTNREEIVELLGSELTSVLHLLMLNFPASPLLHLSSNSQFHLNVEVLCLLITLLCHRTPSPCTGVLEDLQSLYLYGQASHPLYEYLGSVLTNYARFSSEEWRTEHGGRFARGSGYRCSDTCDYVYFVDNCAGVMEIGTCPFCRERIGGRNYTLVDRPGHRNLTDSETLTFILSAMDKHRSSQPAGYTNFGLVSSSHVRNLNPVAHRIMHWCLHGSLYALLAVGGLSEWEVGKQLGVQGCCEAFLRSQVEEDWRELKQSIAVADHYYIISAAISLLPDLIQEHSYLPTTSLLRDQFEQAFNSRLIPLIQQPLRAIREYKETISHVRGGFNAYLEELSADMQDYPLHKLFRMRGKRDFQSFEAYFKQNSAASSIVAYYMENKSSFDQLNLLGPLLALTNHLLNTYSFTLTRSEAYSLLISKPCPSHYWLPSDPLFASLYCAFTTAWSQYPPQNLHYLCTPLPCRCFDNSTVLGELLLDDQEIGGGLCLAAALTKLGELQNSLIDAFDRSYGSTCPRLVVPVQTLSPAQILHCFLESLLLEAGVNSPVYGSGMEVAYDWNILESRVRASLEQAVRVDTSSLHMVKYLGEFLSPLSEHSGVIIDIRKCIPQESLGTKAGKIRKMLGKCEMSELRRLLGKLEQAFLTLLASNLSPAIPISAIIENVPMLDEIPVNCIVALYEELENVLFPSVLSCLPLSSNPDIAAIAACIVERRDLFAYLGDIQTAVRRCLMRCGGSRGVDESKAAGEVIGRPDYWSEGVEEGRVQAVSRVLMQVKIGEMAQLYTALKEAARMKEQARRRRQFAAGY